MEQLKILGVRGVAPRRFPLKSDSILVGRRSYCDLVLDDYTVSREHARFTKRDGRWFVEDLKSRNGVAVDGKRIGYHPVPISNGKQILIGKVELVFESDSSNESSSRRTEGSALESKGKLDPKSILSQYSVSRSPSRLVDKGASERKTIAEYQREIELLEERLQVLVDFTWILSRVDDSGDLSQRFLKGLLRLFPNCDSVGFCGPKAGKDFHDRNEWVVQEHVSRDGDTTKTFDAGPELLQYAVDSRVAVLSSSVPGRRDASDTMAVPVYEQGSDRLLTVIQVNSREGAVRFTNDDLRLLGAVAEQVAVYWANQRQHDVVLKAKIAQRELQLAMQVQRGFLPLDPPKIESYEFFDYYRPVKGIGGDYFDYIPLANGSVAIVLGDVVGNGISAALLMARFSSAVRYSLALEKTPQAAMQRLNRVWLEESRGEFQIVTFIMIVLEPSTHVLHLFNAGHPCPVVSKADGSVISIGEKAAGKDGENKEEDKNFPIGFSLDSVYDEYRYVLDEGDAVSIMSDGLTDEMNESGIFGRIRVEQALRNPDHCDATTLGKRLVDDITNFSKSYDQEDDQCLVVFRRVPVDSGKNA